MPLNVSRLRIWFAAAAILLATVVAGFYFYARLRMRRVISEVPRSLGVNVQQSTQGFTLSKSEGGRTIFTVKASKAVQYKEGGKAELRDVSIVVYGRKSNRFDQIYGSDFEYDAQAGTVSARGEVHIDLEGNAAGAPTADQTPPEELKNPIHLKTSGLVFNQKTGVATTDQKIEFRIPQAGGSALGATYDSRAAELTLHSDIRIQGNEPNPATINARHALITKGPTRAILDDVRVERPTGNFSANQLTVFLRDDNTVERVLATGNVRAQAVGRTRMLAAASRAEASVTQQNALRSATLSGGVTLDTSGDNNLRASAGRVLLAFTGRNTLDKVTALDAVKLLQEPATGRTSARPVEISADGMEFAVQNGRFLTQAVTAGPAQVTVLPPNSATGQDASRTVASAGQFTARFQRNRLVSVTGMPGVRLVTSVPGQPDKISTSERMAVGFDSAGGLASLRQEGNFHYQEAPAPPFPGREAWATLAVYETGKELLTLTGAPRVVEGGMTTTANRLILDRRSNALTAQGDVKTTYSELKPQPGGALLATADPIHVTAPLMEALRPAATAVYSGGARLWQGSSVVEAPVIEFRRDQRTVVARANNGPARRAVSTVFVEQDKSGRATPVTVTASRLTYVDAQRQARFEGGVLLRGAETTVTSDRVDVYLQARGQTRPSGAQASNQIDRIVASGHVAIQQPARRATGLELVYTASEGKFVLTGGPPSIFDAEHGQITGDSLTFFQRDDRVLVESKNSSPTVTHTRIAK